ncbi:hypothetical protein D3C84_404930 [compost metagenome]
MGVDHMQQKVGVGGLFKGSPEGFHQLVRQVTNEAHGIGQHYRPQVIQLQPAQGRIERGEQLIGRIDLGRGQRIEQGGLAGVGITHQGDHRDIRALAPTASLIALAADLLQALLDLANAHTQQAAVGFQLGFTRATQTDTALLALKVGPAAHQARAHVIELGQFDLQLAFMGTGALGEDIEDQTGTVEHPTLEGALEVALLAGCEGVIEDDQFGLFGHDQVVQLVDFATTDQVLGRWLVTGNGDECHRVRTGRTCKFQELLRIFARLGILAFQMNQDGPFTTTRAFEKQCSLLSGVARLRLLLLGSTGQAYRTTWYNGRDGVLVDHLADGVLQQDHELVEGFDLALQLDAVDQIDGNRYAFLTQGIEVRVL